MNTFLLPFTLLAWISPDLLFFTIKYSLSIYLYISSNSYEFDWNLFCHFYSCFLRNGMTQPVYFFGFCLTLKPFVPIDRTIHKGWMFHNEIFCIYVFLEMIKGIQKRVGRRTFLMLPGETLLQSLIRSSIVAVFSLNQREDHSGGKQKEILLYSFPISVTHSILVLNLEQSLAYWPLNLHVPFT